ncbi:MAG TPA: sigma 54-interacting transcriptional regulator [Polyangiaceae bacterium]|nr:sigma 54-interacting transcriptional regulator [Polyangiaceae bacterium]
MDGAGKGTLTEEDGRTGSEASAPATPDALVLAIVWYESEPWRVGEVCVVPVSGPGVVFTLGRGATPSEGRERRLEFVRNRAGVFEPQPPLSAPKLSRVQLRVEAKGAELLEVCNVGRSRLKHDGNLVQSAQVRPGSTLQIGRELLLLCVRRSAWVRAIGAQALATPFGRPDGNGLVGESEAMWELRRQIAFIAPRNEHVLIVGDSGTGKELAARGLHAASARADAPFVSRNAATFPETLIDAELFGHARNYPNMGMAERAGLVAQAHGGTLFLDELGELPQALQTHLLRLLDDGEYQRLGESTTRHANFRLVGATNRPERLRGDLAARFKLSLEMPGLERRREDIPLLVAHLLRCIARANEDVERRVFASTGSDGTPRVAIDFVDHLVRRNYTGHVRELESLLWDALARGPEDVLGRPPASPDAPAPKEAPAVPHVDPKTLSADVIRSALAENGGSVERAFRALGLSSRHVLFRMMIKHGIERSSS